MVSMVNAGHAFYFALNACRLVQTCPGVTLDLSTETAGLWHCHQPAVHSWDFSHLGGGDSKDGGVDTMAMEDHFGRMAVFVPWGSRGVPFMRIES